MCDSTHKRERERERGLLHTKRERDAPPHQESVTHATHELLRVDSRDYLGRGGPRGARGFAGGACPAYAPGSCLPPQRQYSCSIRNSYLGRFPSLLIWTIDRLLRSHGPHFIDWAIGSSLARHQSTSVCQKLSSRNSKYRTGTPARCPPCCATSDTTCTRTCPGGCA